MCVYVMVSGVHLGFQPASYLSVPTHVFQRKAGPVFFLFLGGWGGGGGLKLKKVVYMSMSNSK